MPLASRGHCGLSYLVKHALGLLLVLASGCGNKAEQTAGAPSDLRLELERQLTAAGKDINQSSTVPPGGADNTPFDFSIALLPEGNEVRVELEWTEQLIGDYDQNGEVNQADISPLGKYLGASVTYDDASSRGGFTRWPSGSPADGGGGVSPVAGSSAENWRLSRIDGDGNGQLLLYDISPLAAHWKEQLDGYRVYRKQPGETEFAFLQGSNASLTVSHLDPQGRGLPDARWVVRYKYANLVPMTELGKYEYYVAAYNSQADGEGPPSRTLSFELTDTGPNQLPQGSLTVSPEIGVNPLEVTFDFSASLDPDGSIELYEIDFENDGVFDVTTTSSLPVAHIYPHPRQLIASVRLTDDRGGVAFAYVNVNIRSNSWVRTWHSGIPPPDGSFGNAAVCDDAGNIYVVGAAGNSTAYGVLVLKFSPAGDPIWCRLLNCFHGETDTLDLRYPSGDYGEQAYSIIGTSDGDYIVSTDIQWVAEVTPGNYTSHMDALLFRLKADGQLVWLRSWDGDDIDHTYDLQAAVDGGFFARGRSQEATFGMKAMPSLLQRFSREGELIWQKSVLADGWEGQMLRFEARDLDITEDGNMLLLCQDRTDPFSTPANHFSVAVIDDDGMLLSGIEALGDPQRIESYSNGSMAVYVLGYPNLDLLLSLDSQLGIEWCKQGLGGTLSAFGDGLAFATRRAQGYDQSNALVAVDSDGSVVWGTASPGFDPNWGWNGKLISSGSNLYLLGGGAFNFPRVSYTPEVRDHSLEIKPMTDMVLEDVPFGEWVDFEIDWQTLPVENAASATEGEGRLLWANPQGSQFAVP